MGTNERKEESGFFEGDIPLPEFVPAETSWQRLKQVFAKNPMGVRSFELQSAWNISSSTFLIGMMVGGTRTLWRAQNTWRKTHYHSVFMTNKDAGGYFINYIGRRFFWDGGRLGLRVGIVSGIMSLTMGCLAARRDKARLTDLTIGGGIASALYRIDVGPKAMLATGILGTVFWQLMGLSMLAITHLGGYTWDGLYKALRREYYDNQNAMVKLDLELQDVAEETGPLTLPKELKRRWVERKLDEEARLTELLSNSANAKTASQVASVLGSQQSIVQEK